MTQTNWEKANTAFEEWAELYEEDLTDDERALWIEGYLNALRDAK